MLEEAGEVLELGHRDDQLLQVFEPARRIGRAVGLPHRRCSRSRRARSARDRCATARSASARQRSSAATKAAERVARGAAAVGRRRSAARAASTSGSRSARAAACSCCKVALPMPRRGMLTMRSKARSSAGWLHQPQIGERVADLLALVEARAADHAIGQRQRDEPLLELAGLEAGAHQDRDLAERHAACAATPRSRRRPSAPPPRRPTRPRTMTLSPSLGARSTRSCRAGRGYAR